MTRPGWNLLLLATSCTLATAVTRPADAAATTYSVSGTFGVDPDPSQPSGLAGGTFSGFYRLPSALPTDDTVDADVFEVSFYDATHVLKYTASSTHPSAVAGVEPGATSTGVDYLVVNDSMAGPADSPFVYLSLTFPAPFDGNGQAVPTDLNDSSGSVLILVDSAASIASARSAVVPEPAGLTLALFGLAALAVRSRRRATPRSLAPRSC